MGSVQKRVLVAVAVAALALVLVPLTPVAGGPGFDLGPNPAERGAIVKAAGDCSTDFGDLVAMGPFQATITFTPAADPGAAVSQTQETEGPWAATFDTATLAEAGDVSVDASCASSSPCLDRLTTYPCCPVVGRQDYPCCVGTDKIICPPVEYSVREPVKIEPIPIDPIVNVYGTQTLVVTERGGGGGGGGGTPGGSGPAVSGAGAATPQRLVPTFTG